MLLDAFRRLLEPEFEVVGTASDGHALVQLAAQTRPDVVVLDISMPRLNGMEAAAQLRRKLPSIKVVFLTVNEDPDVAAEAIQLGASGYLLKSSASGELISAIEIALAGKTYITPLITKGKPLGLFPAIVILRESGVGWEQAKTGADGKAWRLESMLRREI